jgi:hypothetical protein
MLVIFQWPALYCNVLSAVPMFMLAFSNGDFEGIAEKLIELPLNGAFIVLFSCIVGTLIG